MRKFLSVVLVVSVTLSLSGCNAYQRAELAQKVVGSILAIAEAEVPQFPQNEQPTIEGYIAAGKALNASYGTCIDNANDALLKKSTKFLDCLAIFTKALNDPKLLASLRVLNPASQKKAQLWLTGIALGVNEAIIWFGGQAPAPASVGAAPSSAELREFRVEVLRGM